MRSLLVTGSPGPARRVSMTDLISLPMMPTFRPSPLHRTLVASLPAETVTLNGDPRTCRSDHMMFNRYAPGRGIRIGVNLHAGKFPNTADLRILHLYPWVSPEEFYSNYFKIPNRNPFPTADVMHCRMTAAGLHVVEDLIHFYT